MGLVTPGIGLVFWTTLSFLIVLFLLKKFAWKPILQTLKERDDSIDQALRSAEEAKKEIEKLQASNDELLKEARNERDRILKEARDTKDQMINEAKDKAKSEADKMISSARTAIENEKMSAITELKAEVANMSIQVAEQLLRKELSDAVKQKEFVNELLEDSKA